MTEENHGDGETNRPAKHENRKIKAEIGSWLRRRTRMEIAAFALMALSGIVFVIVGSLYQSHKKSKIVLFGIGFLLVDAAVCAVWLNKVQSDDTKQVQKETEELSSRERANNNLMPPKPTEPLEKPAAPALPSSPARRTKVKSEESAMAKQDKSISQTMTNSPGGVQVGRDLIVNPQPQPRALTNEQHDAMVNILRAHSGQKLFMVRLADKEAHFLASQIWQTFVDAGWQISVADVGQQTPFYGLRLGVPDPKSLPPDIAAIRSCFSKIGMPIELVPLNQIYPSSFAGQAERENRPALHVALKP